MVLKIGDRFFVMDEHAQKITITIWILLFGFLGEEDGLLDAFAIAEWQNGLHFHAAIFAPLG
jgi:hypothetical protein